ncbi:hypothetical protein CQ14_02180 [Bradyrhizobium lablabi]|uniref:YjiS-like domain-containing protein n=1 Tax=Bradyrhizobium lablabi TaxID=722472 RepID=A0A0R3N973_9BRAD|nr:DUF1127 domain-containing protein [Bradyrhizobium lablabi]KRR26336.1 hypothetical protein CQ14_02180 [Bradyrhizobium lablabi]
MLKKQASLNVNRFVGLHHDPQKGGAVCAVLSDDHGVVRQTSAVRPDLADCCPEAISTVAGADYAPTSLWWSVLASFTEDFGAYGMALYPTANFPVQPVLVARRDSLQDHRGREPTATGRKQESGLLSEDGNVIQLGHGPTLDAQPPWHRSWLVFIHDAGAALWAHWRREREIRRAVSALGQFDDRTLRDMGISSRSEIERVVGFCHDC